MKNPLRVLLVVNALALTHVASVHAAAVVRRATGANAAAIQADVDSFRTEISDGGSNNGVGGSFATGRREINWDGVPDSFAAPNFLPANFFNSNSPRGAVFSTVEEAGGTGFNSFLVSADSTNPTSTPVRFGNLNASYAASFQTFSAERLFHIRNAHVMEITFSVPGTSIPATVSGFGAVFTDVDIGSSMRMACYSADAEKLVSASGQVLNNGLSFMGFVFTTPEERCARIEIRSGNIELDGGPAESGGLDLVVMDDFIYGEPRPIVDALFQNGFE